MLKTRKLSHTEEIKYLKLYIQVAEAEFKPSPSWLQSPFSEITVLHEGIFNGKHLGRDFETEEE